MVAIGDVVVMVAAIDDNYEDRERGSDQRYQFFNGVGIKGIRGGLILLIKNYNNKNKY